MRSLAQTWINKLYCPHYVSIVNVSSGVASFLVARVEYSHWPLLIATINFKKCNNILIFHSFLANLKFYCIFFSAFEIFILPSPLPFCWPLVSAVPVERFTAWEFHQIDRNIWVELAPVNFLTKLLVSDQLLFLRYVPSYWRYHCGFPRQSAIFFFVVAIIPSVVSLLVVGIPATPVTQ